MRNTLQPFFAIDDLAQRPGIHIARAGSIVIAKYGQATVEDLDVLLQHQLEVAKEHGGKMTMIGLVAIGGNVGRIGDDVRQKSIEVMGKLSTACIGNCTVILGGGLGATMIRMFLTGFHLMSRTPFSQKVFDSVSESLTWAQQLPGQTVDAQRLSSTVVLKHFGLEGVK